MHATHPVHAQAAQALKGLDGGTGGRTEDPVAVDADARQDDRKAVLHVGDRVTTVADGQRQAYR